MKQHPSCLSSVSWNSGISDSISQLHGLRQPAPSAHQRPDRWFLNPHPGSSELLYLQEFRSMEYFKQELIEYLDYYNNRRIKAKLKGLLPAIHRQQALSAA